MGYKAIENILSNTERIKLNNMLEELYDYLNSEGFIGLSQQIEQLKLTLNSLNTDYFEFYEQYNSFKFNVELFMATADNDLNILGNKIENLSNKIDDYIAQVETIKTDAKTEITNVKDEAISDITTLKTQIEDFGDITKDELNTVKTDAIEEINNIKTETINEIETKENETKEAIETWRQEVEASDVVTETTINNASLDVDVNSIKVQGQEISSGSGLTLEVLKLETNKSLNYQGGFSLASENVNKTLIKNGIETEYTDTYFNFFKDAKKVGFRFNMLTIDPATNYEAKDVGSKLRINYAPLNYVASVEYLRESKDSVTGMGYVEKLTIFDEEQLAIRNSSIPEVFWNMLNINVDFRDSSLYPISNPLNAGFILYAYILK